MAPIHFVRLPALIARRGTSRTSIYRHIQAGTFPTPVYLSANTTAWPEHEISALDRARVAGASDAVIKKLVAEIVTARAAKQAAA